MKSDYYERREARIERLHARSERAAAEAATRFKRADDAVAGIPMGQPVLVGHHSEKHHRRDLARCHDNMRKGIDAQDKAAHYAGAAHAAEANTAISSDNPDAVELLREKIAEAEKRQPLMRTANRLLRKGDQAALVELLGPARAAAMNEPDYAGRKGFASYELSNNNANIRRMKQRLAHLEAAEARSTKEYDLGPARVVENAEDNRLQLFFDGKPSGELRQKLKSSGFRWAPSVGCWQRHLSTNAIWGARYILDPDG